jgi:hypothetical protein
MNRRTIMAWISAALLITAYGGSFGQVRQWVDDHGQDGWITYAIAATPILMVVLCLLRIFGAGEEPLDRLDWALIVLFGGGSYAIEVWGNASTTTEHSPTGAVVAAILPVASLGALLLSRGHRAPHPAPEPAPEPVKAPVKPRTARSKPAPQPAPPTAPSTAPSTGGSGVSPAVPVGVVVGSGEGGGGVGGVSRGAGRGERVVGVSTRERVLVRLDLTPGMTSADLARSLEVDVSTVRGVMRRLAGEGLVVQDDGWRWSLMPVRVPVGVPGLEPVGVPGG